LTKGYYLGFEVDNKSDLLDVLKLIGTWILIFTNLVPISLLVTLELVKFWQAGFM
jgi:phospholipid-transporting ATPase